MAFHLIRVEEIHSQEFLTMKDLKERFGERHAVAYAASCIASDESCGRTFWVKEFDTEIKYFVQFNRINGSLRMMWPTVKPQSESQSSSDRSLESRGSKRDADAAFPNADPNMYPGPKSKKPADSSASG